MVRINGSSRSLAGRKNPKFTLASHWATLCFLAVFGTIYCAYLMLDAREVRKRNDVLKCFNIHAYAVDAHYLVCVQMKINSAMVVSAHSASGLVAGGKPFLLYGTAWKAGETARYVSEAVHAGFRFIDTACQPKHYNEAGVGDGW